MAKHSQKIVKLVHFRHAIVDELLGLGATVHTCSRNESELDSCLTDWEINGFTVSGSVCDVSSVEQRVKLMENASSVFNGKLNILVSVRNFVSLISLFRLIYVSVINFCIIYKII